MLSNISSLMPSAPDAGSLKEGSDSQRGPGGSLALGTGQGLGRGEAANLGLVLPRHHAPRDIPG